MKVITKNGDLADHCAMFARADYITIDTEFMREKTFWPILCLIQIAGPDEAVAIDPMGGKLDLQPLFQLLTDDTVLKVMHGGRQDIEIFHHLSGRVPGPVYDTQIAAMVCGFGDQVGYETLIAKLTGHRLDKASRFTDWSLRPLSEQQLRYALDDVVHLRAAYERLRDEIAANGRESWLDEEMATLSDPALYEIRPEEAWRRLKPKTGNRRYLAVLQEVAAWREREAVTRDVPRNRIVRDESLSQIAAHPPTDVKALARIRGVSKGLAESRQGAGLLAAVQRGLARPADEAPAPIVEPQRPGGNAALVDLLKVLLKHNCERHHVAQKLVASSAELDRLAAAPDDEEPDIPPLAGWRRQVFGADALKLKRAELALAAIGRRIYLIDVAPAVRAEIAAAEDAPGQPATRTSRNARRRRGRRGRKTAATGATRQEAAHD